MTEEEFLSLMKLAGAVRHDDDPTKEEDGGDGVYWAVGSHVNRTDLQWYRLYEGRLQISLPRKEEPCYTPWEDVNDS